MSNIGEDLSKDHREHERVLMQLAEMVDSDSSLHQVWAPFERDLLEHLAAEERSLFCVFVQAHCPEITALRAEHRQIHYAVIELSVCVELRNVKRTAIDALLELVRAHVEHEDRTLHRWLDEDEGISSRRGVLTMLARRTRAAERTL